MSGPNTYADPTPRGSPHQSQPMSQSQGQNLNPGQRYDSRMDHSYHAAQGPQAHLRDDSLDSQYAGRGYSAEMDRSNSATHLTSDHQRAEGDVRPHDYGSAPHLPPGAQGGSMGLGGSGSHLPYASSHGAPTPPAGNVHYPPSPYLTTVRSPPPAAVSSDHLSAGNQQRQQFTTVPLRDDAPLPTQMTIPMPSRSHSPLPPGSGNRSGANTPASSRNKRWTFFPTHTPNDSSADFGEKPREQKRPKNPRSASWDLLGDRSDWEEYNPASAKTENLRYAEGDVGTNKLSRLYYWALNRGIVVRWSLYIIPILAILWVPGIVSVTAAPRAKVWDVRLLFWSIWLSVLWVGFWASTAAFMMLPSIWRNTVGSLVPSAKAYTDVIRNLGTYGKLITWTLAIWVSFTPIVINQSSADSASRSRTDLSTFAKVLFGLFLCTIFLGIEKLIVQLIALQFHRDSYEDRLKEQKFQVRCLTTLYINSHDIPGRSDTLIDNASGKTKGSQIPKMAIRKALRGLKEVAANTTTALGNVASEMAGQSVLQTNSPANKVTAAISSANKSKALARRIFYSFRQPGKDHLDLADVARFFPDLETAQAAFEIFDKDLNGDATRDEIETACLSIHRERLSLEASMRDTDGAVRRLDDIFLVVVFFIAVLVLASTITTKLTTLVTSAGTFVLGLSWLIGSTMQEILLACIFLFVKHPYDVGDRVTIDAVDYTVIRMNLLSTHFKRIDGKFIWLGHNILTTKLIENVRRSGATSELFTFDVAFDTSFEALQALRARMLNFLKDNARDFQPIFDVVVDDMPDQGKLVLKAYIMYKSNWQQYALKIQRRNKWICALKMAMADLKVFGPAGAGDPSPAPADPIRYMQVPYVERPAPDANLTASTSTGASGKPDSPPPTFASATATGASLTDRREVINDSVAQDVWGEAAELQPGMMTPGTRPGTPMAEQALRVAHQGQTTGVATGPVTGQLRTRVPHGQPGEEIEMISAPVNRRM